MSDSDLQLLERFAPPIAWPRVRLAAALGHTGAMAMAPAAAGDVETRALLVLTHREQVAFACDCVARALHVWEAFNPEDERPHTAVIMARAWLRNQAGSSEVWTAARAATCATADARLAAAVGSKVAKAAIDVAAAAVVAARHAVEPEDNTLGPRVVGRCERAIVALAGRRGRDPVKARVVHRLWRARRLAAYLMRRRSER